MVRKAFIVAGLGVAFALVSAHDARLQQAGASSAATVRLRVQVADALSNSVPDNRFVEGEQVRVKVAFRAPEALGALAALDRATLGVATLEKSADQTGLASARAVETAARQRLDQALVKLADEGGVQESRETLTLEISAFAGTRTVPTKTQMALRLVAEQVNDVEPTPTEAKQVWELPRDQLGAGRWQVEGTISGFTEPQTVVFEIITFAEASPEERGRALYVRARVALDQGDIADALTLAQQAVSEGPPQDYHVMVSYGIVGEAYVTQGELELAIEAYEQAIAIATAAFPTSRLPVIFGAEVQGLKVRLGKPDGR